MGKRFPRVVTFLLAFSATLYAGSSWQPKEFRKWPAGASPQEIGKRVIERFLDTPHLLSQESQPFITPFITYPESVTWYGALTFAQLSGTDSATSSDSTSGSWPGNGTAPVATGHSARSWTQFASGMFPAFCAERGGTP